MKRHVVTIRLGADKAPFPEDGPEVKAAIGDILTFRSPDGILKIHFVDPIGSGNEVPINVNHDILEPGRFRYQCGLTVGSTTFGWPNDQRTESGGEIIVDRPRNT